MLMCQLFGSSSLYLPGLVDPVLAPEGSSLPYENLPGSDFSTTEYGPLIGVVLTTYNFPLLV